jgi:hypothetical protein
MTGMTENRPERLRKLQIAFAAHIRDPENHAAPAGIEDRRMKIYRDLFFNNICSLLASNFPVLHAIYGEAGWRELVREFYSEHHSQTPLFPEVSREFLRYLQDGRNQQANDPGFLLELAHYEWVELALSLDERDPMAVAANRDGDLLTGTPVLSPLAWPLSYRYPVHRIGPENQPDAPPGEPTHILVYRNLQDTVKFIQLNHVSRMLLDLIQQDDAGTGMQLLQKIAENLGHKDPESVIANGSRLLADWKEKGVLLGSLE